MKFFIALIFWLISFNACKSVKSVSLESMDLKNVVIYKTRKDYSGKVPVIYSKNTGSITAYPAPGDARQFVDLKPVHLNDGFILDQVGVNQSTVYLDYTFEEYSSLESAPSLETLTGKIIDFSPFLEMYNLGQPSDINNSVEKLNKLIKSGEIEKYKVI